MGTLRELALCDLPLTDACVDQLGGMTHLRQLDIGRTNLTAAGVQRLRAVLDETLPRRSGGAHVGRAERHDAVLAVHGLPQQEELLRAHRELAFAH